MMACCHILKLPDELLLKIVQCIPPTPSTKIAEQCSLSDYRSVSLVCRQLNRAATSVLYAHYALTHASSAPFITTLFHQPRLARLVHSVKGFAVTRKKFGQFERSTADTESLIPVIHHLNFPEKDRMLMLCRNGGASCHNVEAALILAMTSNVQTLVLKPMFQDTLTPVASISWQMILAAAQGLSFGLAHMFEHLRVLKLNMPHVSPTSLSIVLLLKSLVDLTLIDYHDEDNDYEQEGATWECPLKASSIRTIRLDRFEINTQLIVNLISSCRSLEGFALRVDDALNLRWDIPKYSLLIQELHRHQPELLYLDLIDGRYVMERKDSEALGWLDRLKDFKSLKYLAVPLELAGGLGNSDTMTYIGGTIPCDLQTLIFTKGHLSNSQDKQFGRDFCDGHIQSILQACQTASLKLKRLGVHYYTDFKYADAYYGYADSNKDLARMEDVHFDFSRFTREFKECKVWFDYEIRVVHNQDHEAHERLISVRRIHGDAVADEYSEHLSSTYRHKPWYNLKGFPKLPF